MANISRTREEEVKNRIRDQFFQEYDATPIIGDITDLKKNLNNHSGMNQENRKRFICGFFLASIKPLA